VSLPIWRKNVELPLVDFKGDYDDFLNADGFMALFESPEDIYQLKKHPFRALKISHWLLNFDENEEMLTFWTKVGPLLTHLQLNQCAFERVEDFRKILFQLTPNLESLDLHENNFVCLRPSKKAARLDPTRKKHLKPKNVQKNLKKLQVELRLNDDAEEDNDDNYYVLPVTWIELFAHFPNIEHVMLESLNNKHGAASEELVECVNSMQIVRDNLGSEYFANLREFQIDRA